MPVDQCFADRLAILYLGLDALRVAWPGDGVHVYRVGAGTAVDDVPGKPVRDVDGAVAGKSGKAGGVAADRVDVTPAVDRVVPLWSLSALLELSPRRMSLAVPPVAFSVTPRTSPCQSHSLSRPSHVNSASDVRENLVSPSARN